METLVRIQPGTLIVVAQAAQDRLKAPSSRKPKELDLQWMLVNLWAVRVGVRISPAIIRRGGENWQTHRI